MSFDINWNLLRDGDSAEQLQRWLNDRLREMDDKRPSFLGPLSVTDLDFGEKPPTIAIQAQLRYQERYRRVVPARRL
ncbi:hypothetical protein BCR33DRAFT_721755 [Rhizoclosmatium globosum]|uniref:SMP-LTD domain-containing protein n=1 Tax=Rhizoclosmatium globosum TaxID=329046 RepID=A0A1Y2BPY8_9FUNG|nr:hypothetical protein BCR33DRAFT_721755 [Rhizoclosmatium globosum]|eukprot:ORY36818.1 hypothetical protein BCR33DRAFT_721755 [Rhizoclosmatium globosum]